MGEAKAKDCEGGDRPVATAPATPETGVTTGTVEPAIPAAGATAAPAKPLRWSFLALLVLALAGLGVSVELTRIHVQTHTNPAFHSFCALSKQVNCETVAASPWSVFLGLPVSVWGLFGYALVAGLAGWGLVRRRPHPAWPCGLLLVLGAAMSVVSAVLGTISVLYIESLCILCLCSYVLNFAILGVGLGACRRARAAGHRPLAADLRGLAARPAATATAALVALGAVVAVRAAVPAYWESKLDLPYAGLPTGHTADGHPWIGAADPDLVLVEFSDYQCPYCGRRHEELRRLVQQAAGRLQVVHRHLPLDQACHPDVDRPFHRWSCRYAEFAACADEQGKFWAANDFLFQQGRRREPIEPRDVAAAADLDERRFAECLEAGRGRQVVAADIEAARALQIRGTPTFLFEGKVYPGQLPPEVTRRFVAPGATATADR